jgi:hypothetical protein
MWKNRYSLLWVAAFLVSLLYNWIFPTDFEGTSLSPVIPYLVIMATTFAVQYFKLLGEDE